MHIAKMLTGDAKDYAKALRMIESNKRLLRVIKIANEDIAPAAVRGAVSGADTSSQSGRHRGAITITDN